MKTLGSQADVDRPREISGDELPPFVAGTGLEIPSNPGHYSMHPFPGLAAEITVVKIPNG